MLSLSITQPSRAAALIPVRLVFDPFEDNALDNGYFQCISEVIVATSTYFYDTILYYHSHNHHPILIAIYIATLILQSATVLGKIKKDRFIEMGIWANLLGTNEDKINFAAIPANNH